jgi:hypothetical protein
MMSRQVVDIKEGKSLVSTADVRTMVAASNILMPELAAAWGYLTPRAICVLPPRSSRGWSEALPKRLVRVDSESRTIVRL